MIIPVQPSRDLSVAQTSFKRTHICLPRPFFSGSGSWMKNAGMAHARQLTARTTAVVLADVCSSIQVTTAPPALVPARLPAVCHPEARPFSWLGRVIDISARTAEEDVATVAWASV